MRLPMSDKKGIIYEEDCPVTIVRVENGYKVIQAKELHAYNKEYVESHARSIRTGEYVFNDLADVYGFLKRHFEA